MNLKIRPPGRTYATIQLALAVALFALAASCTKDSNAVYIPESANTNNAPANASPPANTSSTAKTTPLTAKPIGLSPTETVKGYYEAGMKRDLAGAKSFLSRASLQLMEDIAKREGKTPDQLFSEAADMDARKPPPVFSNERITGDTATVDIQPPGKPPLTIQLVKEEGEWKLEFGQPKRGAAKR